jgi:hypothetical protein
MTTKAQLEALDNTNQPHKSVKETTMKITYTALRAILVDRRDNGRTILMRTPDEKLLVVTAAQAISQTGKVVAYRWQLEDLMATGMLMGEAIRTMLIELNN